ncbi:MAG: hypothetical protein GY906_37170 [bacterium]|nr:hypothetical protein [bacterium]
MDKTIREALAEELASRETQHLIDTARLINDELYRRAKLRDGAVQALEDARKQAATWADREVEAS